MKRYTPKDIETKWQRIWEETGIYTSNLKSSKPKYIAMSMFNYPSGSGIHIGHAMNYTIPDVKARFKRQQGYESYHPVGWDAFGLPAENFAIKSGVSPQESMATIIPGYHKQYKAMGWSNDWEKEIATHLPEYYRWTQWIFIELYRHGLAYQDSRLQWWCDIDKTVLANEQVIDGKCWRHDSPDDPLVEKREVKQWFFKITEYADELLEAIDDLDWSESVKLAQKNWIGKSKGAEISFKVEGTKDELKVFTTRPDTIFGATFMVLAPEHELVSKITSKTQKNKVDNYIKVTQTKSEVDRQAAKKKTGEFTGAYAINPANNEKIPIWIADYVLASYGTGAIMAVPGHDQRDFEFAKKYKLPILPVILPDADYCITFVMGQSNITKEDIRKVGGEVQKVTDSGFYCVKFPKSKTKQYEELINSKMEPGFWNEYIGEETVFIFKYKDGRLERLVLNDKNHNRIRKLGNEFNNQEDSEVSVWTWLGANEYYAEFFLTEGEGRVTNSGKYNGMGSAEMREKIVKDLEARKLAKEKTNYRMNDWSVSRQRYWGAPIPVINCPKCGPVLVPDEDLPVLLPEIDDYQPTGDGRSALAKAKDWLKVDCPKCHGPAERETDTLDTYLDSSWYMYRYFDPRNQEKIFDSSLIKKWEPIDFYNGADHATAHLLYARFIARFFSKIGLVNEPEPFKQFLFNGKITASDGKMFSKSKGNGVDPLEIINSGYGADSLRVYLMFAAPLDLWMRWDPKGVPGAYRFLNRLWGLVNEYTESKPGKLTPDQMKAILRAINPMIKKVTEDIEANRYNTAIAAIMSCLNELYRLKVESLAKDSVWQQALESIVACTAPFAPHISDELWNQLGHSSTVHIDSWPKWQDEYLTSDKLTIIVQVNGKLRGEIKLPAGSPDDEVIKAAKSEPKVKKYLSDKDLRKQIVIKDKLVNFVVG